MSCKLCTSLIMWTQPPVY